MMILQVGGGYGIILACPYPVPSCTLHRRQARFGAHLRQKGVGNDHFQGAQAELIAEFGNNPQDSGNPKAQVAIMSERIRELTEHMKSHPKDFHTRRGLLMIVGRRRRLLSYIKKRDIMEYRELIAKLGIRDNIQ